MTEAEIASLLGDVWELVALFAAAIVVLLGAILFWGRPDDEAEK